MEFEAMQAVKSLLQRTTMSQTESNTLEKIYFYLGCAYQMLGQFQREQAHLDYAVIFFEKQLEIAGKNSGKSVAAYGNLGNTAILQGDYFKAIELLEKCQRVYSFGDDIQLKFGTFGSLSLLYRITGQPTKAQKFNELRANILASNPTLHSALPLELVAASTRYEERLAFYDEFEDLAMTRVTMHQMIEKTFLALMLPGAISKEDTRRLVVLKRSADKSEFGQNQAFPSINKPVGDA